MKYLEGDSRPTVSVIIPAYNRAKVIERAINSAIAQTFRDLEIIVVDDGSTDNTRDVVQALDDERIRYIRRENNAGPGAARNEGMRIAEGEFIAFLDSDDEWFPGKTAKQVKLLESLSEDWGICYTGSRIIKDGTITKIREGNSSAKGYAFKKYVLDKIFLMTPTAVMIRRDCVNRVGMFDDRLLCEEDTDFFFRILRDYKLAVLSEVLTTIHRQTTKSLASFVETSRLIILDKQEKVIRSELGWYAAKRFRGHSFWVIAEAKFREREIVSGLIYLGRAIACFPLMAPSRYGRMFLSGLGLINHIKRLFAPFR
ncbi:hypothetical protein C6A37_05125 [Desulfobacteraceae bacterium SEEP-SAG9]|nr:hypothetical protein C6A37_05125 [Desulfobacteraceae bacterium SEEP-SAG9]